MTLHLVDEVAKDGNAATITGGARFNDESGTGAGPVDQVAVLIDSTQNEILGTTADAAVSTDANGSVNAHIRGIVKLLAAGLTPLQGTFTDRSGSMTTGGTSKTLAVTNSSRKRIYIENPSSAAGQGIAAAESLYINFTSNAGVDNGTSIELTPGGIFDSGPGPVSTEQINVNAATTSHVFIAKEM